MLGDERVDRLKQTARDGVELGEVEELRSSKAPRKIPLSEADTETVWIKMWPDVKKGWAMCLSNVSKAAQTGLVAHPVFCVPKRNEQGVECGKRVVTHCSVENGYNTFCNMDIHPPPSQPKHTCLEKGSVKYRCQYPFSKVFACLKDVDAAFKRARLAVKSIGLFGISVRCSGNLNKSKVLI